MRYLVRFLRTVTGTRIFTVHVRRDDGREMTVRNLPERSFGTFIDVCVDKGYTVEVEW